MEKPENQLQNIQRESLAADPTEEKLPTWLKRFPHIDEKNSNTLLSVDQVSSERGFQGVIPVAGINTDEPLDEPKLRTSITIGINSPKNKSHILNDVQRHKLSDKAAKRREHKLKLQEKNGMHHQGHQILLNFIYTQGLKKNQTLIDLLQMKAHVDSIEGRNPPMEISRKNEKRLRRLSTIDLDSSKLSNGAKSLRDSDLRALGLWPLWADMQKATQTGRNKIKVVPIGETLMKNARKRQRRLQEVTKDPKPSQMHRAAVEKHLLDNTWLSAGVQTGYEEPASTLSMTNQNPSYSEDIEHTRQINEVGSSIHMGCTEFCESASGSLYHIDIGNMENTQFSDSRGIEQSQMPSDDKCPNPVTPCSIKFELVGIRLMEDAARCLQVTIIPEGYPHMILVEEQAGMIRNALLAKLDLLPPGTTGPKFSGIDLIDGAIVVLCSDAYSQRWLEHVVEACSPSLGLNLTVSTPAVRASTWVPGPCEDPEVILRRLCTQNEGLSTRNWRVLDRKVMEEGQELTVLMEESDWRRIKEVEYMPHVNFSRILFTAM
ncbi:unnamed protein product [Phaedon cochleariae]|uniref:DUF4780 domain-containing protein n=1 Tax=Phaedon cochleariae TaxID=80249 RepID=A0A9P0DMP3_PHACE|nr:unnamed protein product [Phaedon cochleariae]